MTIKTGLVLGIGIGIGTIIGMGVSEDRKIEIINKVKGKIIFALTGEEWKPKKPVIKPNYNYSYSSFSRKTEEDILNKVLTFDSHEEAKKFLQEMKKYVESYPNISVHSLYMMRQMYISFVWDAYGWDKSDIDKADVIGNKISLSRPIVLEGYSNKK